ncbi:Uncharacterized protein dnm_052080 [Desulfonema magnum]|uniref:Uncharacterized protein n=1 Tax=Desulfonema magnum TaxID=45655 RepID=A0A975GPT3_9BACT|nr:Uncharacterized protein dnm_052080 [Desulfonema magnum]
MAQKRHNHRPIISGACNFIISLVLPMIDMTRESCCSLTRGTFLKHTETSLFFLKLDDQVF